jgi:hypothetical protein
MVQCGHGVERAGAALFSLLLAASVLLSSGCSGDDALNSPAAKKLKALGDVYLDYAVAKSGGGPADQAQLVKHMRSMPEFVLRDKGIDPKNLDDLFTSERDQEPFVVLYGTGVTEFSGDSKQVLAYEKTGKNGKRLLVFASTKVAHVDEAELEQLKKPKS